MTELAVETPPQPAARAPSVWRAPQPSARWFAVWRRNFLVWKKLAAASLLGNVAEPLITLVAFGYSLGSLVGSVQGVPYVLFLASGSAAMSVMNAATFESLYSAFSRMHVQRTWESILFTPTRLDDVVLAEIVWAASKALLTGVAMVLVIAALGISRSPFLLLALPAFFLVGMVFAAMGLVFTAVARGYDFFTYYFTLFITPMMFLSGVFFPQSQLPGWLQALAQWLPLAAAVDLVRPLFLGRLPAAPLADLALLAAWGLGSAYLALALTRRRFAL
jgi:lipooligosaccharide transport system permease protein